MYLTYTPAIALPTQKLTVEKDAEALTTKRKLTFDALLVHMKHYNASTRRGDMTSH